MKNKDGKPIKAVFLDIDGTYFDHKTNRVHPSSKKAVKQLQEKGYKVALCSGRPLQMAKQLGIMQGMIWDGFIGSAGAVVYDAQLQMLANNGFCEDTLFKLFQIANTLGVTLYTIGEDCYLNRYDAHAIEVLKAFHVEVPNTFHSYRKGDDVAILSLFEGYDFDYSPFLNVAGVALQKSSGVIMDLVKEGVNKALGITQLMEHWGIVDAGYIAFGDSMNDKEMLQQAAMGIAMGNATKDLLPYAHMQCGSSDQDSIYQALVELGML